MSKNFKEGYYVLDITAAHIAEAGTEYKSWERNPVANAFRTILPQAQHIGSDPQVTLAAWYSGDSLVAVRCAHPAELYPWFEAWESGALVQPSRFTVSINRNHEAEDYERRLKERNARSHAAIADLAEREHRHWQI